MARREKVGNGYVKKETMLVVAFVALTAGLLGGIIYSSFTFREVTPQQQRVQGQGQPVDESGKILALEAETIRNPKNVELWTQLGNLYFDANSYQKAIMAYKKSLELDPNNADVWTDMGVMYRRSGQPDEAINAFDKAIELDPLHNISRFNKGIVLMHDLNDQDGAMKAWEELVRLNPSAKTPTGELVKDMLDKFKATMKQKGPTG